MNKLTASGIALSGITITALAVAVKVKTTRNKQLKKEVQKLRNFNGLAVQIVMAQLDRPDGAGILIPEKLQTALDAFVLLDSNGM